MTTLYRIDGVLYKFEGLSLVKAAKKPAPGQLSLFDEMSHPRAHDGKFTSKGSGSGSESESEDSSTIEDWKPPKKELYTMRDGKTVNLHDISDVSPSDDDELTATIDGEEYVFAGKDNSALSKWVSSQPNFLDIQDGDFCVNLDNISEISLESDTEATVKIGKNEYTFEDDDFSALEEWTDEHPDYLTILDGDFMVNLGNISDIRLESEKEASVTIGGTEYTFEGDDFINLENWLDDQPGFESIQNGDYMVNFNNISEVIDEGNSSATVTIGESDYTLEGEDFAKFEAWMKGK